MHGTIDIERMITQADGEFPALFQLFGGYFHEDWREDNASPDDVIDAFLREAPQERLLIVARRAADELDALPVRAAALPDGTQLRELLTGAEGSVSGGRLSLANLPEVGARIWRIG